MTGAKQALSGLGPAAEGLRKFVDYFSIKERIARNLWTHLPIEKNVATVKPYRRAYSEEDSTTVLRQISECLTRR